MSLDNHTTEKENFGIDFLNENSNEDIEDIEQEINNHFNK